MSLTIPTIHLNGSSRDTLLEQVMGAGMALNHAIEFMQDAAPNARDYYPQGEDAYRKARAEHESRIERARALLAEYRALAEAIAG